MNIERVYKKVLEGTSRDYLLSNIKDFVDDNKPGLKEITKAQWNGLLSFCTGKDNIGEMIAYIQEKMEKGGSPWKKVKVTEDKGEKITIGEYIITHLQEIKEGRLANIIDETKYKISKAFPGENVESILTDEEETKIVLLQARLFIRTLVKNVLIKFEGKS